LKYQASVATAQNRETLSAGRCSWFFSSKLKGSRPRIPGQAKPVTKMPAAMTAIRLRGDGAEEAAATGGAASSAGALIC
jgi:hypothetical protein